MGNRAAKAWWSAALAAVVAPLCATVTLCATAASAQVAPAVAATAVDAPASASATSAPPVTVEAKLSTTTPTFGDRVELRVTLRHPPHVRVFFPSKPDLRPLLADTRDPGRTESQTVGGMVVETAIVPALAVRTGALKLPAIEVPWTESDASGGQGRSGTVTIAPLRLTVKSQFAGDNLADPAPPPAPRALVEENVPLEIGLLVAVMMAVSALATAAALRFYRDRAARRAPKPPTPAHTTALARLDELERSDRLQTAEPGSVFAELSEILRQYLGGRYRFLAIDMTSTELLAHLKGVTMRGVQLEEIASFAELSDLVKFAHVPASPDELRKEAQFVRKVVERTQQTALEQAEARRAEDERLARIKRLRLQVMAPHALRLRALAIDVLVGALAMALLGWVAIDTANRALFDACLLLLPVWLVLRDVIGPHSPGKAIVGLQIADNQDETVAPRREWLPDIAQDDLPTARMADAWPRLLRNLSLAVPVAGLVVEAATCLNLPESRRLGDQWADTRVIDAQVMRRRGTPSWAPAVLLLVLAGLLLLMPWAMGGRPA